MFVTMMLSLYKLKIEQLNVFTAEEDSLFRIFYSIKTLVPSVVICLYRAK
jgi:hypothetical protein